MSSVKLAAVVCIAAVLAFVAAAAFSAWWPMTAGPTPVAASTQSGGPASPGNEERLQRAMTFTTPAEPAK